MPARVRSVRAWAVRIPRDSAAALGSAGTPAAGGEPAGRYRWASTYRTVYSDALETVLVKVETDTGLVGWGEAQVPVAPHLSIGLGPQMAAAVHLAAATPNLHRLEHNPHVHEIAARFTRGGVSGSLAGLALPDGPGLGIEVDEAGLAPFVV